MNCKLNELVYRCKLLSNYPNEQRIGTLTLTHLCPPFQQCCPRHCVSRHNGGTSGAPLKPIRDDSVLRALSSLRGLRGAPEVPPLCRETQSLRQHMLELGCENATVGTNGLTTSTDTEAGYKPRCLCDKMLWCPTYLAKTREKLH